MSTSRPWGLYLVKRAESEANGVSKSRQVWLVAVEADGRLGPELHLTALDAADYAYWERRLGQIVPIGVMRRK